MYKKLLLPVDLAHEASWQKALPVALSLGETYAAELHLLAIVPDLRSSMVANYLPDGFESGALAKAQGELEALAAREVAGKAVAVCHIGHGDIAKQILEKAGEIEADLIVMASHDPNLSDYLLGSNADRVVRHAHLSVLVVRT